MQNFETLCQAAPCLLENIKRLTKIYEFYLKLFAPRGVKRGTLLQHGTENC